MTQADRSEATAVLRQHWQAGTLDPGDHERRTTAVRSARTRADLDAALADLPSLGGSSGHVLAHRDDGGERDVAGSTSASVRERDPVGEEFDDRTNGLIKLPYSTANTLMALTPFACVALFFLLHVNWVIFLAIPVVGILLFGGEDDRERRRGGRRRLKQRRRRQLGGR